MQSRCDVCLSVLLSFCQSVIIDREPVLTWVLQVGGNNGGVFLEAQGEGFRPLG